MNITGTRSLIHNRNKRDTHEYNSFFIQWTETSVLRMNITGTRSLIHKPKQARHTWIYLDRSLSMNRNKNATHEFTSHIHV